MRQLIFIISFLFAFSLTANAQEKKGAPREYQVYILVGSDTIPMYSLRAVHVYAPLKFKNKKHREEYTKLVRDVRKTYPYARMITQSIVETYEYMQTLPNDKSRQKHMEEVEKFMMKEYKPKMKKMTRNQGKILMKLVDRQCNTSSYNVVKAMMGSLKAGFYNTLAGLFGNSLKVQYDPEGKDAAIERIVQQIEDGTIDYYYSTTYMF